MIKPGVKKSPQKYLSTFLPYILPHHFIPFTYTINPLIDAFSKIMLYLCEDDNMGKIIVLINRLIVV